MSPSTARSLRPEPTELPREALNALEERYERGQYVTAFAEALAHGPLHTWQGLHSRVLAGRLSAQLGAPRLSRLLAARAYRQAPSEPITAIYWSLHLLRTRGPLSALGVLRQAEGQKVSEPTVEAQLHLARSACLASLRDFSQAETWLARAETLVPKDAWLWVQKASLLESQDRTAEALEAARHAMALRPGYRPAVQMLAHHLFERGQNEEALALLEQTAQALESGGLWLQLASVQRELGSPDRALESLWRALELTPLLEREGFEWLAGRFSDAAYECGQLDRAVELARLAGEGFFASLADRLEKHAPAQRVQLAVPYVRQNHLTCAPATLSSIASLWKRPADHLSVAEQICYDGTPSHSERRWAEQNGWAVRSFTVTWEGATALLDRGVAFTLATVEPAGAHLQAIIGYDSRRRTLLVRDPSARLLQEFAADALLERYAFAGPRGMALVPKEHARLLEGLCLEDAELYDTLDELESALAGHDRARAARLRDQLEQAAPGHRLTLSAARALARYDENAPAGLAAAERLLALFAQNPVLQLDQLALLRELGRRTELLERLRALCAKPKGEPEFLHFLAAELLADAREHAEARFLLGRYLRRRPQSGMGYSTLGHLKWAADERATALELYRFALCLEEHKDSFAQTFFDAGHYLARTEEVLGHLRDRFARFGARSGAPARTLYFALTRLERTVEAFEVLAQARQRRPDDSELMLFEADACARHGKLERAEELLGKAHGVVRPADWRRSAAAIAELRGRISEALLHWKAVLELEPLAMDAHRAVCLHLLATAGAEASLEHLAQAAARFPHHHALHQLWLDWLRERDPLRAEEVLEQMLARDPSNAWAGRERALLLSASGRFEQALQQLERQRQLEPNSPQFLNTAAKVLARAGRLEEARSHFRLSLCRSVDSPYAIRELLAVCATRAQRLEALAFVHAELERQVLLGDGLLSYQAEAQEELEPEELLGQLQKAQKARPDLWAAWMALLRQLRAMKRAAPALELAQELVARFPLVPASWLELAFCARAANEVAQERLALERALALSPGWNRAAGALAELFEREGELGAARQVLERASGYSPLDASLRALAAELLWKQGERPAALDRLEQALRIDPDYPWAWERLEEWTAASGEPERAKRLARELTGSRGGQPRVWLSLASLLAEPPELEERLTALGRATQLEPQLEEAYDLRAYSLARAGRFEEALEACRPPAWKESPPLRLRGRAAWLMAEQGKLEQAVAQMRELVEDTPAYSWGLVQLHQWYERQGNHEQVLWAAQRLAELAPAEAESQLRLGKAQQAADHPKEAKECFGRALELATDEEERAVPGMLLFDLHFEEGALDRAGEVLERLPGQNPFVAARAVQLSARRGAREEAEERLGHALAEAESEWPAKAAVEAMERAGWRKQVERALAAAVASPSAHAQVAYLWGIRLARSWWPLGPKRVRALLERGPLGVSALTGWLEATGEARRGLAFGVFLLLHRARLRQAAELWGTVGYGLFLLGRYRAVLKWLGDWRGRSGVRPWMLLNGVLSAAALRRWSQHRALLEAACELPADHVRTKLEAMAALETAISGDKALAQKLVARRPGQPEPFARAVYHLAEAALLAREGGAGALAEAKLQLQRVRTIWGLQPRGTDKGELEHRAGRFIARRINTLAAWWWWLNRA